MVIPATKIKIAEQQKDINYMREKIDDIDRKLDDFIHCADSKYAFKDEFVFWRNLLISGIIVVIFVGVIISIIK